MSLIDDLHDLTDPYLAPDRIETIDRAFQFAAKAHDGQYRTSGEPYISHPVQVARILARMRLDHEVIAAALLHDVMEDTPTVKLQIATEFGDPVAELVDGVSKFAHYSFEGRAEAQAGNFRKMLMAMTRDIRVVFIKLADRLHNMRTLDVLSIEKQRRIARETLEIYAPMANRLGLRNIQTELEKLGFRALYPWRYRVFNARAMKADRSRKRIAGSIEAELEQRLGEGGIEACIKSQGKCLYHLYRKMRTDGEMSKELFDVHEFRVLVQRPDDCYRALGIVHSLYPPKSGRFKDYVATPKKNGYQSLHTILFGPSGTPIEVQIRTEEMNRVAEVGLAAHWVHTTGQPGMNTAQLEARDWVDDLGEIQTLIDDSAEFIEHVKVDLFPKDVYVRTPGGGVIELPHHATPIDFAYAVHTDIGNQCVAVKVDERYAPLGAQLSSGQIVEVVTAAGGQPNAAWLNFVVTAKARTAIRNQLKHLRTEDLIKLGKDLLTQALAVHSSIRLEDIPAQSMDALLKNLKLASIEELCKEIGTGKQLALLIARRLGTDDDTVSEQDDPTSDDRPSLCIYGLDSKATDFAKCCHPIHGDPIAGLIRKGRGLVIHTIDCKYLTKYSNRRPDSWVTTVWPADFDGTLPVGIRIGMKHHLGALTSVTGALAEMGANIVEVHTEHKDTLHYTLYFAIEVRNRVHLARIIRRIRVLREVSRVTRTHSQPALKHRQGATNDETGDYRS